VFRADEPNELFKVSKNKPKWPCTV
jgi:hypothetical protein